jgi:nickel-type superoxide dismutase maturation protease
MSPLLVDGECAVVDLSPKRLRPGDVVLARHPYRRGVEIVKRIRSVEPDGGLVLLGDNAGASTDSRTFGALDKSRVLGKVVSKTRVPWMS